MCYVSPLMSLLPCSYDSFIRPSIFFFLSFFSIQTFRKQLLIKWPENPLFFKEKGYGKWVLIENPIFLFNCVFLKGEVIK